MKSVRVGIAGAGFAARDNVYKLLEVADEFMQHVQTSTAYQKLNDEQKVKAFRAVLSAYVSTTKRRA
jgi:hypothetical protein